MTTPMDTPASATRPTAVITGASSGIGAATAKALAAAGFDVVVTARRVERLEALVAEIGDAARAIRCDVTSPEDVAALAAAVPHAEVLIGNAGGALGVDPVLEFDEDQWRTMWETNVLGLARTVRAFAPQIEASGNGRIVVITSVAGHQTYPGGGGYTSAKHAAAAVVDTLRVEWLGKPVRVIEVAPGMVDTEFSTVRLGDEEKAAAVYDGLDPLTADDIAEAITWAVTRPPHMTVARLDLFPRQQGSARDVSRRQS
ncbi:MAG: SDR family NAD(P)-dependent oxidoreductase [Solirubrobacteraceae bacterium]|nr:SDR family NAD(P)-dependent oxidoreductase [Patulibacter sp.]